ncbi:MAG: O-antigen ligase family protein [Ruminococcaceae bacterium]|nr:O-antigen ligase family protein [Oscillospiraceae bacterium]
MNVQEQYSKKEYLASFIVAYVASLKGLNQLLGTILNKSDGIMVMNLVLLLPLIALHFFISDKGSNLNLNKKSLLFVYYIVGIIVVHKYAHRTSSVTYEELIVLVFIPIYLSFYKIDVEKVLRYVTYFSLLILPFSGAFFQSQATREFETIGMTTSYNTLIFITAAALHFCYYKKDANIVLWGAYAVNIMYLAKVLTLGSRGPFIAIVVFFVLLILHQFDENGKLERHTFKKMFVTVAVGFLVMYVVSNLEEVLRSLDEWLRSMGIEVSSISKSIHKLEQGDLSNGRSAILDFTKEGIREHYLVGNGVSTMLHNSNYTMAYPHNIFYQLWYDLGVVVSIPLFYLILKAAKKTLFDASLDKNHAVILMFMFTLSIPRLCMSSQLWVDIPFWFLIMYTITPNVYKVNEEDKDEENSEEELIGYEKKLL